MAEEYNPFLVEDTTKEVNPFLTIDSSPVVEEDETYPVRS